MSKKVINKIPLSILQSAQEKLEEAMNMLGPYLVVLSPTERQVLVEMNDEYVNFIEVSYGLAVEDPDLLSCFLEAGEFEEDFSIVQGLLRLAAKLNDLKNCINDTEMVAGNYGLQAALAFYNTIKIAARHDIPGTRVIFEELKARRPHGRRKLRRNK